VFLAVAQQAVAQQAVSATKGGDWRRRIQPAVTSVRQV